MKSVVRGTDTEVERGAPLKFRVCAKSILAAGQPSGWRESTILDRIKWNSKPCHFPILDFGGGEGGGRVQISHPLLALRINHFLEDCNRRLKEVYARDLDSYPRGGKPG